MYDYSTMKLRTLLSLLFTLALMLTLSARVALADDEYGCVLGSNTCPIIILCQSDCAPPAPPPDPTPNCNPVIPMSCDGNAVAERVGSQTQIHIPAAVWVKLFGRM